MTKTKTNTSEGRLTTIPNTTRISSESSNTATNNHSNSSFYDDDDDDTMEKCSILNDNHHPRESDYEDMIHNKLEKITNSAAVSSISESDLNMENNNSNHFIIVDDAHETTAAQQSYESISNVLFHSSFIIDDDEEQKKSLMTDIRTSSSVQDTSLSNSDATDKSSVSVTDQIHLDHCDKKLQKNPPHHEVTASETATTYIRKNQLDHDINNVIILNGINGHHVVNGLPHYKDQVNNIRSARNNINYQKSGGVAEYITTTTNYTNNSKENLFVMAGVGVSDITTSSYNTISIGDILEQERNENVVVVNVQHGRTISIFDNNEFSSSLRNEIIQSSAMNNKPEQQNIHEDNHPVVAEAYKVSSLIIEAQPVRRTNHFILVGITIVFVMIVGMLIGLLCRNGACSFRSSDDVPSSAPTLQRQPILGSNNDNNIDVTSSALTSQHQPISDRWMLMSLVDQYINGTFDNQVDKVVTTTIERFGIIEYWDVTNITDLSGLYATWRNKEIISFNANISPWDVKNAIYMTAMFNGAASFNGNLSLWDVSNVQHFVEMFSEAKSFQGIGLENWILNPLFVDDISHMFTGATLFDCNLSSWDVSGVTLMIETFANAQTFSGIGLEHWNTSQLTNASSMFAYASLFSGDLSHWDVSQVKSMNQMFAYASSFDSNLSTWDVRNVTDMSYMFTRAEAFKGNGLSNWDVSEVEEMSSMFEGAISFNTDLSNWNVTMISSMSNMFSSAYMFDSDLSRWDVTSVVTMSYMFSNAVMFNQDLSRWDVSNVRELSGMFSDANNFNSNLSNWNISYVTNLEKMFASAYSFNGDGLSNWNVSNVVNIDYLFAGANQFDADLSMWDVSRVTTMRGTFISAFNFTGTGIDQWNVKNVENMYYAFFDAQQFNANLSLWNVTKVISMEGLFYETLSFRGIGLSEWNVRRVEFFNLTFHGSSIIDVDLSKWNVQSAISMSYMFANTPNFDSNLSSWNVTSIQDLSYMFSNATSFRGVGLENWILNNDAILDHMFCGADSFDPSYISSWNITLKNVYC